jgi:hypothetical protein
MQVHVPMHALGFEFAGLADQVILELPTHCGQSVIFNLENTIMSKPGNINIYYNFHIITL